MSEKLKELKKQIETEKLRLVVFKSAEKLGNKVDEHLLNMYGFDRDEYTFIVPISENFFQDGHFKVQIEETVRGKDLFFLTDIGNYSLEYKMHGFTNHTSPQDLFCELKDGIGASNCHAQSINVVMPLLYAGRQHRRNKRENLACGAAVREVDSLSRIKSFVTFDAHDQGVEHAVHNMEFDNVYPTNTILEAFINNLPPEELSSILFVAPDNGAGGRRDVYLNSFACDQIRRYAGSFYKKRDYNKLVNGKYKIIAHEYYGDRNLEDTTAIITDDMISSGGSMFDVIDELNKMGITRTYIIVTYALFTEGIEKFNEYYRDGKLNGIYTTNLSYIPEEYQNKPWLNVCDCSMSVADIIYSIHNDKSISPILRDRSEPIRLLERKFGE